MSRACALLPVVLGLVGGCQLLYSEAAPKREREAEAGPDLPRPPDARPDEPWQPPIISSVTGETPISEFSSSKLSAVASDPHGGELSYVWKVAGGEILGDGPVVSFKPPEQVSHPCPYTIELIVTSAATKLSASRTVEVRVWLAGDFDRNGAVDADDQTMLLAEDERKDCCASSTPCLADADGDCEVTSSDLSIFLAEQGMTACPPPKLGEPSFDRCISELSTASIIVPGFDPQGGDLGYEWSVKPGEGEILGSGPSVKFKPPSKGPHPCPTFVKLQVASSATGLSAYAAVPIWVQYAGDLDQDGDVDMEDWGIFQLDYARTDCCQAGVTCKGDLNHDCIVDIADSALLVLGPMGGCTCPP